MDEWEEGKRGRDPEEATCVWKRKVQFRRGINRGEVGSRAPTN